MRENEDHDNQQAIERQYALLSVLDGKASGLLTFNAVALASLAIWLQYILLNWLHFTLDVVFVMLLVSCGFLLTILFVRWGDKDETSDRRRWRNEDYGLDAMEATKEKRTRRYRVAWYLSISSVVILVGVSTVHAYGTLLAASGNCGAVCESFYSEDVFGNVDRQ